MKPNVEIIEALKHPEHYIPNGIYCRSGYYTCPFYDVDTTRPYMEDGYCHYLKKGDWDFYENDGYLSLLWDMCKECGINDDWGEDELS